MQKIPTATDFAAITLPPSLGRRVAVAEFFDHLLVEAHRHEPLSHARNDIFGGLVSAAVAVPLAMGYGMFAFAALGEDYFAYGALAGIATACVVAVVCMLLGDKTTTLYAPRVTSTFFLGLLIYGLVHSGMPAITTGGIPLILATTFSVVLLGGALQALFGLAWLGTLIKFAPQPVMAGFQNAAAALLFLVQLGNVCGFDRNIPFMQVPQHLQSIKPLSVAIAAVTFAAMWNARKWLPKVPPIVVGIVTAETGQLARVRLFPESSANGLIALISGRRTERTEVAFLLGRHAPHEFLVAEHAFVLCAIGQRADQGATGTFPRLVHQVAQFLFPSDQALQSVHEIIAMIQGVSAGIEGECSYSLFADPAAPERAGGEAADQSDHTQSGACAAIRLGNPVVAGNGRTSTVMQLHADVQHKKGEFNAARSL
jgi:Sulfate permease family